MPPPPPMVPLDVDEMVTTAGRTFLTDWVTAEDSSRRTDWPVTLVSDPDAVGVTSEWSTLETATDVSAPEMIPTTSATATTGAKPGEARCGSERTTGGRVDQAGAADCHSGGRLPAGGP